MIRNAEKGNVPIQCKQHAVVCVLRWVSGTRTQWLRCVRSPDMPTSELGLEAKFHGRNANAAIGLKTTPDNADQAELSKFVDD